ncbi:LD-carboxypeptidase [Amycolatopsis sp. NPDC049868]|uniref:LD-carboxypeptidase n=1 Tax=Amycolatopsis sp. NPDC049868 TaxID=3363934 RepID=UPI0037BCC00B
MIAPRSTLIAPMPRPGDHVRLDSPASFPSRELVAETKAVLESWGLVVEIGAHALDQRGFMAGRDEDRLADLDDAFRDPAVRAVIATRGGAGAYRIADDLDFAAVLADPKPMVGFSDITALHLALWRHCGLAGIHGFLAGSRSAAATRKLLMAGEPAVLHRDPASGAGLLAFLISVATPLGCAMNGPFLAKFARNGPFIASGLGGYRTMGSVRSIASCPS